MKITIQDKQAWRKAVSLLRLVVPTNTPLPVLCNVRVETRDGVVVLTSTDLDTSVIVRVALKGLLPPVRIDEPGTALVPFSAAFRNASSVSVQEGTVVVMAGGSTDSTSAIDADEFPKIPADPLGKEHEIELGDSIRRALIFASTDQTRLVLNGAHISPRDGGRVEASDGRRIISLCLPVPEGIDHVTLATTRLLQQHVFTKAIHLSNDATRYMLRGKHVTIVGRLAEGTYPDAERVIPQKTSLQWRYSLSTGVLPFLRNGARTADVVQLIPDDRGRIMIAASNKGGNALTFPNAGRVVGQEKPVSVGFNPAFLADCMPYSCDFGMVDEQSPARFDGQGGVAVLMPIRVV